ncbi:MAG: hypothetical protein L7S45_02345 [Luminiphilus sp.]|nr:hypothetical protein [Luminiphilus sp.]
MVYIQRNAEGEIIAVSREQTADCDKPIEPDNPELIAYFASIMSSDFYASDLEFIRVIDDLIHVLVDKKVIMFTELPPAVQTKIAERSQMRERNADALTLVPEDDALWES